MSEGRRSQVVLLDERRLDLILQSRLFAGELLDIVASHFNLKEKEYFGLAFVDDTGQYSWLQLDKRVLEHDFPKKNQGSVLIFYFRVKYFVESITQLRDSATIEAFYLQTKSLLAKGELEVDSDTVFQLAALVIQATYGDYVDDQLFKSQLKKLPVLPTHTLKENLSISACEQNVLEHYKVLTGQSRGAAIVNYLSIAESLPTYGQHYYEIKDKSGTAGWLGLSYRGISQYDKSDRCTPKKVFLWKQLENLYFRDKKFTIEVHEARRVIHTLSSFNLYEDAIEEPVEEFDDLSNAICDPTTQVSVSRRTLAPANVTVYVWYASSPLVAKCIWSMAIAQHQFFLDRSHRKSQNCVVRNLSQIASELCRSVQSLSSASSQSNISRSTSSNSLPAINTEGELTEESKAAATEMLTALQSRKDALQDALKKKTEELKALCLKEGEITGELPPETPLHPGEAQPQVRRRVGTSFMLSDKFMCRPKGKDRESLNNLELDYEIQSKITSAAFKLANDITARKSVRKVRKLSYLQATSKLRDIEEKLCTLKREKDSQKKKCDGVRKGSSDDSKMNLVGLPNSSSENSISSNFALNISSPVLPSASLPQLANSTPNSAPPSPAKCKQRHRSLQHVPIITTDVYEDVALPFSKLERRNSSSYSAASEYDTVSCGSSIASLGIPYKNRFEANLNIEGTNHYSVPNRRASQVFNDPEELSVSRNRSTINATPTYDDHLNFSKAENYAKTSYNNQENNVNYDNRSLASDCHLAVPNDLHRVRKKMNHSHSENSLHRSLNHKLDHVHISDDSENRNPNVYTMPLRNGNRTGYYQVSSPTLEFSSSKQSISQVVDLVQASVLLQDCKRANSSSSLEYCSPKAKTKEWIETSLDSPISTKKRKPKPPEIQSSNHQPVIWQENGLPPPSECNNVDLDVSQEYYPDYEDCSPCSTFKVHSSPPSTPQSSLNSTLCAEFGDSRSDLNLHCDRMQTNRQLFADSDTYYRYENAVDLPDNPFDNRYAQNNDTINNEYPVFSPPVEPPSQQSHHYQRLVANNDNSTNDYQNVEVTKSYNYDREFKPEHHQCDNAFQFQDEHSNSSVENWNAAKNVPLSPNAPANLSFSSNVEVNVVSVGHFQPYWEETKPYELSDFYKYSTKHRKQQKCLSTSELNRNEHNPGTFSRTESLSSAIGRGGMECGNLLLQSPPKRASAEVPSFQDTESSPGNFDRQACGHAVLRHQGNQDKNASFGESEFRISLADTFHEEMLAWYQSQESVKKATLV